MRRGQRRTFVSVRGALPGLAVAASAALPLGCVEPEPHADGDPVEPMFGVAELGIDRGGTVRLEPGSGIGLAVEYAEGGRWSVTTACDTALSGATCSYDLLLSTDEESPIGGFSPVALEPDDFLDALDPFAVAALLDTQGDTDGFGFTTSPGATVRVSALLYDPAEGELDNWSDDPRLISWVGSGAVHRGAPTNPVDLTPDRP